VISACHQLFQTGKSFRMAKSDLQSRPVYHRKRHSIEAHLTIVFAALAVSRWIEDRTGWSIRKFVRTARRYRTIEIQAGPTPSPPPTPPRRPPPRLSKQSTAPADLCTRMARTRRSGRPPSRPRVAADGAGFQAEGVIDDELSRAVVAYLRGAGLAWPRQSLEAVAGAMGADTAQRLEPRLKRLADETLHWPVDWDRHDLLSAMEVVRGGLTEHHPELSSEAVEALVWEFSYAYK
jgi:hypothetical protein